MARWNYYVVVSPATLPPLPNGVPVPYRFAAWQPSLTTGGTAPILDGQSFAARLVQPFTLQVDAFRDDPTSPSLFSGAIPGFGALTIANGDGAFDALCALGWDGRDVEVYRGPEGATSLADCTRMFYGTAADATWDRTSITIPLRDFAEILNVPVQDTLYAGTGGMEGGAALTGRPKPLMIGEAEVVEGVLVSATESIYQWHDGVASITALRDRGALYGASAGDISDLGLATLSAWTPVAGQWITDAAHGSARIGSPPDGVVTADVAAEIGGTAAVGPLARYVVTRQGTMAAGDVDLSQASVGELGGFPVTAPTTIAAVLDQLMVSGGGFWTLGFNRALRIVAPLQFATSVGTIDEKDCLDGPKRVRTESPIWRQRFGFAKTWRVHTAEELAASVIGAEREALMREAIYVVTEIDAVRVGHPLATTREVISMISDSGPAGTAGGRQMSLLHQTRHRYELTVRGRQFQYRLGDTVTLRHPRFGLAAGKDFLVTGLTETAHDGAGTALRLYGPRVSGVY